MITRTLTQVKVFDVKANGELIGGQGGFGTIPELNWVEGQVWESDAECDDS